jgi:hypothetical protein
MVIFTVMFKVLIFALCIGAIVAVLVFVPLGIYSIPYALWVGCENTKGRQKDKLKKGESIFYTAKCATKLYKAWITRQKPTI